MGIDFSKASYVTSVEVFSFKCLVSGFGVNPLEI